MVGEMVVMCNWFLVRNGVWIMMYGLYCIFF